jgi:hypothetical protein
MMQVFSKEETLRDIALAGPGRGDWSYAERFFSAGT